MARRTRQKWDSETERAARNLDALAEYEEFCRGLLPKLRRMVLENWPPEKIRKTFGSLMQAQVINKALHGNLPAAQDTLDRLEGKSIKRQEVTHPYAKMNKAELAALALQKLQDAGLIRQQLGVSGAVAEIKGPEEKVS